MAINNESQNYDAIDQAAKSELSKFQALTALFRAHYLKSKALTFLYTCLGVSAVVIAIAVVYWLFIKTPVAPISKRESRLETAALKNLASKEPSEPMIETSFTVFSRVVTDTGEIVVTGKSYRKERLNTPYEQYCYLESVNSEVDIKAIRLAEVVDNKINSLTKDKLFLEFGLLYCRFYIVDNSSSHN